MSILQTVRTKLKNIIFESKTEDNIEEPMVISTEPEEIEDVPEPIQSNVKKYLTKAEALTIANNAREDKRKLDREQASNYIDEFMETVVMPRIKRATEEGDLATFVFHNRRKANPHGSDDARFFAEDNAMTTRCVDEMMQMAVEILMKLGYSVTIERVRSMTGDTFERYYSLSYLSIAW